MIYDIHIKNIANKTFRFEYDGIIGNAGVDYTDLSVTYSDITIQIDNEENMFKLLTADATHRVRKIVNVSSTACNIFFNGAGPYPTGLLWIGNELFLWNPLSSNWRRGVNGTRKRKYEIKDYLIAFEHGRPSPIGIECDIYYEGSIVYRGSIYSLETSGAGYIIQLQDILSNLDIKTYGKYTGVKEFIEEYCGFKDLIYWKEFQDMELEELELDEQGNVYIAASDILNQAMKAQQMQLVMGPNGYGFVKFDNPSTFSNLSDIEIDRDILMKGGLTYYFNNLLTDILIKYSGDKEILFKSSWLAGSSSNEVKEIDLSLLKLTKGEAEIIAGNYSRLLGITFGTVQTSAEKGTFKIGNFYRLVEGIEIAENTILQCVNLEESLYTFIVVRDVIWNPISLSVPIYWDNTAGVFVHDPGFECLINSITTMQDTLVNNFFFMLNGITPQPYYYLGDPVEVLRSDGTYTSCNLISSSSGTVGFDTAIAAADGEEFELVISKYSTANVYEKKWLYNLEGVL